MRYQKNFNKTWLDVLAIHASIVGMWKTGEMSAQ